MPATDVIWTQPRIAGALIIGSTVVLLAISLPFYLRGDIRAVEVRFRPGMIRTRETLLLGTIGKGALPVTLGPLVHPVFSPRPHLCRH